MDIKLVKMWKEAVVAYFDKLFGSLLEILPITQSRYANCGPSLEPVTS
jgi:hypothetical protein